MNKGNERRKQLLEVALKEFIAKGFYGTSTREICRKVGISSGLLFHYFPNKESIYLELVKIGTEKMQVNSLLAMKAPREYLFQTLCTIFEQLENNPFFAKMFVFIDDAQHADTGIKEVRQLLDQSDIGKQWIPIIEKGQTMKCFQKGNAHTMCVILFGAIQGIAQEKVRMPKTSLPDVDWLMQIIEVHNVK